jgi:hypothetical protein
MSWFSKSPFGHDEDPVEHMLALLCNEAAKDGTPLTDKDRAILAQGGFDQDAIPEDLRKRVKDLIARILIAESDEFKRDPKSFNDSIQWADPHYPNIAALAEEVAAELGVEAYPPLRGWARVKDRVQLVGCGCLVVLLMFTTVMFAGYFLGWK